MDTEELGPVPGKLLLNYDLTIEQKPKASASRLERTMLNSPLFPIMAHHEAWTLLLFWGGLRNQIRNTLPSRYLHLREAMDNAIKADEHSKPLYEASGAPRSGSVDIYEHNDDFVIADYSQVTIGTPRPLSDEFHENMGLNYNYPRCCIDNFLAGKSEESNKRVAEHISGLDPERLVKDSLIYIMHAPCDPTCEATRDQSESYKAFIRTNFPTLAKKVESRFAEKEKDFAEQIQAMDI